MINSIVSRERPSFETANTVVIQRCLYGYHASGEYIKETDAVIDIGCANGYGTEYLARFSQDVTGVDYSKITVEEARGIHQDNSRLSFVHSKVPPLPFSNESVDVVTSYHFIEHIRRPKLFIKEVDRVLRSGGLFICSTPNRKKTLVRNPYHIREFTFEEMRATLSHHFDDFTLLGLHGNEKVNAYLNRNKQWVDKVLRFDPLGLHKMIPSFLLQVPYNLLTNIMRNDLFEQDSEIASINQHDFYLSSENLDEALDIFLVARKTNRTAE